MTLATKEWVISLLNKALGMGGNPTGTIINYMGNNAPKGYLACDGAEYNIADYKKFADYLQKEFGSINYFGGDGITSFKVPDLRGEFLRGAGTNAHMNCGSGSTVGAHQEPSFVPNVTGDGDAIEWISATTSNDGIGTTKHADSYKNFNNGGTSATTKYMVSSGSVWSGYKKDSFDHLSVRPTNTSILYCIKY